MQKSIYIFSLILLSSQHIFPMLVLKEHLDRNQRLASLPTDMITYGIAPYLIDNPHTIVTPCKATHVLSTIKKIFSPFALEQKDEQAGRILEKYAYMREKYKSDSKLQSLISLDELCQIPYESIIALYDATHYFKQPENARQPYVVNKQQVDALSLLPDIIKNNIYFNNKHFHIAPEDHFFIGRCIAIGTIPIHFIPLWKNPFNENTIRLIAGQLFVKEFWYLGLCTASIIRLEHNQYTNCEASRLSTASINDLLKNTEINKSNRRDIQLSLFFNLIQCFVPLMSYFAPEGLNINWLYGILIGMGNLFLFYVHHSVNKIIHKSQPKF